MTCHTIREHLPLLDDPEIDQGERTELLNHVSHCPECARQVDLLRESRRLLHALRSIEAPAKGPRDVMDAVRESQRKSSAQSNWLRFLQGYPTHAGSLVLGAIMVFLLVVVPMFQEDEPMQPSNTAPSEVSLFMEADSTLMRTFSAPVNDKVSDDLMVRVAVRTDDPETVGLRVLELASQNGIDVQSMNAVENGTTEMVFLDVPPAAAQHLLYALESEGIGVFAHPIITAAEDDNGAAIDLTIVIERL